MCSTWTLAAEPDNFDKIMNDSPRESKTYEACLK